MINLDYKSRVPIYEQIVMEIERYVALDILKENDKIPSIRQMAIDLGINPNTVKKAYTILENKGVITSHSTKGTYISNSTKKIVDKKIEEGIRDIKDKIIELEKLGIKKEDIIDRIK